ncbi:hypothetical protein HDV02_000301 [Globomyces sp. JEL0801]|nr:hypothetical protein HDV02_000301 [Globomyces sp. JEL0801]
MTVPATRGHDDIQELIAPCADYPLGPRQEMPIIGGKFTIRSSHSTANVNFKISFSQNPTSNNDFVNITGQEMFTITKIGNSDTSIVDFSKIPNVKVGVNATIQSIFLAPKEDNLYNCADIVFVAANATAGTGNKPNSATMDVTSNLMSLSALMMLGFLI